jgi:hypothetical protein
MYLYNSGTAFLAVILSPNITIWSKAEPLLNNSFPTITHRDIAFPIATITTTITKPKSPKHSASTATFFNLSIKVVGELSENWFAYQLLPPPLPNHHTFSAFTRQKYGQIVLFVFTDVVLASWIVLGSFMLILSHP